MSKVIIATNGEKVMTLEDFLSWEWDGGRGTYESDLRINQPSWDELPLNEKFVYMANSIYGDMISCGWRLEISTLKNFYDQ